MYTYIPKIIHPIPIYLICWRIYHFAISHPSRKAIVHIQEELRIHQALLAVIPTYAYVSGAHIRDAEADGMTRTSGLGRYAWVDVLVYV